VADRGHADADQVVGRQLRQHFATQQGATEKAVVSPFETILAAGQSTAVSIPRAADEAPARIVLSNAGGHLDIVEALASVSAQ
jgi:hypothetical protein